LDFSVSTHGLRAKILLYFDGTMTHFDVETPTCAITNLWLLPNDVVGIEGQFTAGQEHVDVRLDVSLSAHPASRSEAANGIDDGFGGHNAPSLSGSAVLED